MSEADERLQITLSVQNLSGGSESEFVAAANEFVEELKRIHELDVEVPQQTEPGARGLIAILTAIIIWGAKIGAFKALYNLCHDLLNRYHNAEVVLKFQDGSTLKLTGLSREEAERRIEEHLRKASAKA